jgi:hypothetical protein
MTTVQLTLLRPDTGLARRLGRLNAPDAGTVAVTVRPDTRREGWLARDLLAALGVRSDVTGQSRRDTDDQQLAPVWLAAHAVRDLVVVGVEALTGDLVHELVEIATLAALDLWLVADHTVPEALTDALADWPVAPCPPDRFTARWLTDDPAPTTAPATVAASSTLPAVVPQSDFTVFRATAQRQLPPEQFEEVDRHYRAAAAATADALAGGEPALEVLRTALTGATSPAETTTTARAVQAAAFVAGWHLRVDLPALLAHADHLRPAAAEDPTVWRQLRAYRQPHRQAGCTLTLLGLSPARQQQARFGDLDPGLEALNTGDGVARIPAEARPALHALRLTRLAAGATADDPLLGDLDGTRLGDRVHSTIVTTAQRELGLRLTSGQVERATVPTDTWARRRNITCTAIGR